MSNLKSTKALTIASRNLPLLPLESSYITDSTGYRYYRIRVLGNPTAGLTEIQFKIRGTQTPLTTYGPFKLVTTDATVSTALTDGSITASLYSANPIDVYIDLLTPKCVTSVFFASQHNFNGAFNIPSGITIYGKNSLLDPNWKTLKDVQNIPAGFWGTGYREIVVREFSS